MSETCSAGAGALTIPELALQVVDGIQAGDPLSLVLFAMFILSGIGLGALFGLLSGKKRVNTTIQLDKPKVVDFASAANIEEKAVYCRCWKSKTFPMCDGSHEKHNKATGDNTGPLIVKAK
eukprot:CAMPEP_0170142944 /NCGR_PEP_ID=MMETSP0033_2-20121228/9228_1 /TAXON_ID=195969 /ORGANISM="Dolichomastix tenuilepis, Strain CCMP3274" /LENGTH=120 /DNA_ID=CAMNT_0010379353 /DNA_START=14 /DNA_END=376 /DNA_ORIENTATION=+